MKSLALCCVCLVCCLTIAYPVRALPVGFSVYAYSFMDNQGRPSAKVNVSIPYTNLVFFKKQELFESTFNVYIKILDGKNRLVETAVLEERVVAPNYRETRAAKNFFKLSRVFLLNPGAYVVECAVAVKNTKLRLQKSSKLTVPNFLAEGIGISEPRLLSAEIDTVYGVTLTSTGLVDSEHPDVKESSSFADFDREPAIQFEVYSDRPPAESSACELVYEVVNQNKRQHLYGRKDVSLAGLTDQFVLTFNVDDWDPGAYIFNLKAVVSEPPREARTSLHFTIEFSRSMLGRHFDQTLSILSLIADSDELKPLREAPYNERPKAWSEFWKRRDPTPGTEVNEALEEHLRRVRYVSAHFSSVEPGWKTDRGRVYIRYGAPDQVDTRMDPYLQGEYLIWRYYERNLTFVFYDRYGLGDFRLVSSSAF